MEMTRDFVVATLNEATCLPLIKKLESLEEGRPYRILRLRVVKTRYGRALMALLQSPSSEMPPFNVFLPKIMGDKLDNGFIQLVNFEDIIVSLEYGGKVGARHILFFR